MEIPQDIPDQMVARALEMNLLRERVEELERELCRMKQEKDSQVPSLGWWPPDRRPYCPGDPTKTVWGTHV